MITSPITRPITEPITRAITATGTGGASLPANAVTTNTITDFVTTDAGDYVLTD